MCVSLWMHVCVCVSFSLCMYVCICLFVFVYKCVCVSVCMRVSLCVLARVSGEFAVNNSTGVISTARPLDYERNSSFILKVEADSMRVVASNQRAPSKGESSSGEPGGREGDRWRKGRERDIERERGGEKGERESDGEMEKETENRERAMETLREDEGMFFSCFDPCAILSLLSPPLFPLFFWCLL